MGNDPSKTVDKEISKKMKRKYYQKEAIHGLLLLGAGESGKSTFMRQMRHLWGEQYQTHDRSPYRKIIWGNMIESLQILCTQSRKFSQQSSTVNCAIEEKNQDSMVYVLQMDKKVVFSQEIKDVFQALWEDPGIQATYSLNERYYIMDSAGYLFDHMDRYIGSDFVPSFEDICRCRVRTLGISQEEFDYENITFRVYDVGGQRNERKKWLHQFDHCKAVLFVCSLAGYKQVTFEDERTNRMHESLTVYDTYLNNAAFADMNVILFLNKTDLFFAMIGTTPFYMYQENNPQNQNYTTNDANDSSTGTANTNTNTNTNTNNTNANELTIAGAADADENGTDNGNNNNTKHKMHNSFTSATATTMAKVEEYNGNRTDGDAVIAYITAVFTALTSGIEDKFAKRIFFQHLTCATNTESVRTVFNDVRHIIVKSHLKEASLYT